MTYKTQRKSAFNEVCMAIFACLATRTIHIEIVTSLATREFISCLIRFFFPLKDKSQKMFTDNAQIFIGGGGRQS